MKKEKTFLVKRRDICDECGKAITHYREVTEKTRHAKPLIFWCPKCTKALIKNK